MGAISRTSDSVAAVSLLAAGLVVVLLVDFVVDLLATDFVPEGAVDLDAGSAGFTGVTSDGDDCAPVTPLGRTGATGCVAVGDDVELEAGVAAQSGRATDVRDKRTMARRWSRRREICCMVTCFLGNAAGQGRCFSMQETRA
jgi:hypothetical protein